MTEYFSVAHKLNEEFKTILLKGNVHFRASMSSISMISISNEKPELGVKCNAIRNASAENIPVLITQYIGKIAGKPKPGRYTPEKELQARIINYALHHNYSMPFDPDIKFITSELAIKNKKGVKIVNDILGYCESSNQICVIELKTDRSMTRLKKQLEDFEKIIFEMHGFFSELLKIHGFAKPTGYSPIIKKIVAWPYGKSSPKKELKDAGIDEFNYHWKVAFIEHALEPIETTLK